jgi:hypothetical protein
MHIVSKISNISKFIKNLTFIVISYRDSIQILTENIESKIETGLMIYRKHFEIG